MPLTKHLPFCVTFCIAVLAAAPGAYAQPTNPETTPRSDFQGTIGRTADDSEPALLPLAQPRPNSPNIIYIVLDDTGFSDLASYGSRVDTPHMDTLAADGLQYTTFHSKAICSPTRASLLTGRNNHSVGMKELPGNDGGYPHARGRVGATAANVAQMLQARGYSTLAAGKWHLVPATEIRPSGDRGHWPLQKGFDRFYGFLSGWTDQYRPDLVEDNHAVELPDRPDYHFSEDIVDRSIKMLGDNFAADAEKPFFLYLGFGATHAPVQVAQSYIDKYATAFDRGWDLVREERYRRQIELGVIPADTVLPPRNPGDPAWEDLSEQERTVYARFMAAYAGFLEHTDAQIGRLIQFLKDSGEFDNTAVFLLSDNGGAPEAGPGGRFEHPYRGRMTVGQMFARLDDLGGRDSQPLYQRPWAMVSSAPFKYYKLWPYRGGGQTPFIVSWPAGIRNPGRRTQFVDVIDVTPTVLDIIGIEAPAVFNGMRQMPIHGKSIRATFDDPNSPNPRDTQYFELWGSRSIFHDGWKAIAIHTPGTDFDNDRWELYHVAMDFSESVNLASRYPERVEAMKELWWSEAAKHGALPLLEAPGTRQTTYRQYFE